jgi:hypothetical protein
VQAQVPKMKMMRRQLQQRQQMLVEEVDVVAVCLMNG